MRTIEKKLQELGMRVSLIEKRLRISQPEQYDHLTPSEVIKRLNSIIRKANSETGLSALSATEIASMPAHFLWFRQYLRQAGKEQFARRLTLPHKNFRTL